MSDTPPNTASPSVSALPPPGPPPDTPTERRSVASDLRVGSRQVVGQLPVIVALALIVALGWTQSSHFMTSANLLNIVSLVAPLGIIAVGTLFVMIAGEIDLSIGSTVGLISIIAAKGADHGTGTVLIVAESLGAGLAVGLLIGLAVTLTRAPSFMITLGALSLIAGAAAAWTNNQPVTITTGFTWLGVDRVAGVPSGAYLLVGVLVMAYFFLYRLRVGRLLFAVGGNEEAARLVGARVNVIRVVAFGLNGVLVALGATILTSFVGSGGATTGADLELQIIAAVVIGGATLSGGHGSLFGALLGVILLTTISNVLDIIGAQSYISTMVFGAFIVLAVGLRGERTQRGVRHMVGRLSAMRASELSQSVTDGDG